MLFYLFQGAFYCIILAAFNAIKATVVMGLPFGGSIIMHSLYHILQQFIPIRKRCDLLIDILFIFAIKVMFSSHFFRRK